MAGAGCKGAWYLRSKSIEAFLLDITGVLMEPCQGEGGARAVEGSVDALKRLQETGIPIRLCTNETQCSKQQLVDKLARIGYCVSPSQLFPPAPAACHLLKERGLRPHLLVHPDVLEDFAEVDQHDPNCVVVGDATEQFTYDNLNKAFQLLMALPNPVLVSLGRGRYYKEADGLKLDVGPYMKALEYACDVEAVIVGKPSPKLFLPALADAGVEPRNALMIGDDIVYDIGGAQACGMMGVQVRTGKFRPEDEPHATVTPDGYVDNLAAAVELYLKHK